jgi:hypothetical protein
MKKLYEFIVNKVETNDVSEQVIVNGETLTRLNKVETPVPHKFFIRKPNRSLHDEAELYYGQKVSEGIKAGLMTRQIIAKRYEDDGGVFAKQSSDQYDVLLRELGDKHSEIVKMDANKTELSEDEKAKRDVLIKERNDVHQKILQYENTVQNIYSTSAESRAERKMLVWWILRLAFKEEGDKEIPYFGDGPIEDRLKILDALSESSDAFEKRVQAKFMYLIASWYKGHVTTETDFKEVEKTIDTELDNEFKAKSNAA